MPDFADILSKDAAMAPLTYYRIGGTARRLYRPRSPEEVAALLADLTRQGEPWRVIGGGANLLVCDGIHEEAIIATESLVGLTFADEGEAGGAVLVRAAAGESFPRLVATTVRMALEGCEALAGIPGQVGGICAMNAGGRQAEFGAVVAEVELVSPEGERRCLSNRDGERSLSFSYRRCELPPGIVTAVTLRLVRGDPANLRRRMSDILSAKKAAQPLGVPSSGCIFKNPGAESAGLLIERLGLKGERRGDAEISRRHGNFILNRGAASSYDVLTLVELIEERAQNEAGVELEREIKIWAATSSDSPTSLKGNPRPSFESEP
ncbi:MAG: UDP-N-acetylmuramate dehydrogenase [Planctomycetota bacterium]